MIRHQLLLIATAALFAAGAVAAAAGRPAHSPDLRAVPAVNGRNLVTAYAELHRHGFRVTFTHAFSIDSAAVCIPLITSSAPIPGRSIPRDSTVVLETKIPPCALASPAHPMHLPGPYRVPSFLGQPLSVAVRWIAAHKLLWAAKIPSLRNGIAASLYANYLVTAQKPQPNTRLTTGAHAPGGGWRSTPLQLHLRAR